MTGYWFALTLCVGVVVVVLQLLRSQRIREKFAAIWIGLAIVVALLGAFPDLAVTAARAAGVQLPINLVFALAFLVLFIVCVQLSVEVSKAQEATRVLVERVALLRLEVEDLQRSAHDGGERAGAQDDPTDA